MHWTALVIINNYVGQGVSGDMPTPATHPPNSFVECTLPYINIPFFFCFCFCCCCCWVGQFPTLNLLDEFCHSLLLRNTEENDCVSSLRFLLQRIYSEVKISCIICMSENYVEYTYTIQRGWNFEWLDGFKRSWHWFSLEEYKREWLCK